MTRENHLQPWCRFDKVITLPKRCPRRHDQNEPDLGEVNEQQKASEATNLTPPEQSSQILSKSAEGRNE